MPYETFLLEVCHARLGFNGDKVLDRIGTESKFVVVLQLELRPFSARNQALFRNQAMPSFGLGGNAKFGQLTNAATLEGWFSGLRKGLDHV